MENEKMILERLAALEKQIAPMAETARSISELREELAPRVNEAVHALIRQLADVEADFQIEDLLYLVKKAMRNVKNFHFALDQLKNLIDFALTVEPLLKSSVPQLILYLDELEQKGVFHLLTRTVEVLKNIGTTYSDNDLEQIGKGMVHLVGTLSRLTQPEALEFLDRAADLPARIDLAGARETGPLGLLWALRGQEARQGLGVLVALTTALGSLKTAA